MSLRFWSYNEQPNHNRARNLLYLGGHIENLRVTYHYI